MLTSTRDVRGAAAPPSSGHACDARCELRPGGAVTVADLAEQLQIGRTPVFQAIDRLTVDGLVEVMPRKGVVVAPISMGSLIETIEMRLLNESQAAAWARSAGEA